jgi:hypothetical protein
MINIFDRTVRCTSMIAAVAGVAFAQPVSQPIDGGIIPPVDHDVQGELTGIGVEPGFCGGDVDLFLTHQEIHLGTFGEFEPCDRRVTLESWVEAPGSVLGWNSNGSTCDVEVGDTLQLDVEGLPPGHSIHVAIVRLKGSAGRQMCVGLIGISENGVRFLPLAEPGRSEADEDHLFHTIYDLHPQPAPCEFADDQYDTCAALAENDHRSCEDKNDQDLALVATTLGAALITCGLCLSRGYP